MMTLMRRAGGFSSAEQLKRIYDNMHPDYKLYVRISDIGSINELQIRAREYEEIEQEKREAQKRGKTDASPVIAAVYNKTECCWRCKQRGLPMQAPREEILLPVWPRRGAHERERPKWPRSKWPRINLTTFEMATFETATFETATFVMATRS